MKKQVLQVMASIIVAAVSYTMYMIVLSNTGPKPYTDASILNYKQKSMVDEECVWYHNKHWWTPFNLIQNSTKLHSIKNLYEIGEIYNYSIPLHDMEKFENKIERSLYMNRKYLLPASCSYNGKIFNIGIQKTGTTSLREALQRLNFKCNKYDGSNIPFSCRYHRPERLGYYIPNILKEPHIRLYSPFHVDDISFLFINDNYTKDLYLTSYVSQIFSDQPWAYLYPVFDKWYPSPYSKFIYTVRKSTKMRVNSAIKFELLLRINEYSKENEINGTVAWNNTLQHELINYESLQDFMMLNARVYEKQHENVLNYFGEHRIGGNINDDLLILCIECEANPWETIFKFLGCKLKGNVSINDTEIPFPHQLDSNITALRKYSIPQNVSLDWKTYKFGKYASHVLDIIYNQTNDKIQILNEIKKYIWKIRQ